jgi:hypothetical protein
MVINSLDFTTMAAVVVALSGVIVFMYREIMTSKDELKALTVQMIQSVDRNTVALNAVTQPK